MFAADQVLENSPPESVSRFTKSHDFSDSNCFGKALPGNGEQPLNRSHRTPGA
jgi:hypothetical protein